jgi:hypothetical protein
MKVIVREPGSIYTAPSGKNKPDPKHINALYYRCIY